MFPGFGSEFQSLPLISSVLKTQSRDEPRDVHKSPTPLKNPGEEEAIAEIHVDLDRRATAILQLKGAQEAKEATSATSATSVFQEEALEAELLQEESLFHLRHRQVQGLEERLQDLLAQERHRRAHRSWYPSSYPS